MFNKKSIELSLNFIVVIILTLVIFGFGIYFISTLSSQATNLAQLTWSDLDKRISDLACDGSARVCISPSEKEIRRKKYDVFGIKIVNVINDMNFEISVSQSPTAVDKSGNSMPAAPLNINPKVRTVEIKKNDEKQVGVGIEVPSSAKSGRYIFNAEIKTASGPYVKTQIFYVDVP